MALEVFDSRTDVRNLFITPEIRSRVMRFQPGDVAHGHTHDLGHEMFVVLTGQAEFTIGLWRLRAPAIEGGLHAMAFVDAGRAWSNPDHAWDVNRQHIASDGGLGLATSDDNLRVYCARDLQKRAASVVISLRLQRPF